MRHGLIVAAGLLVAPVPAIAQIVKYGPAGFFGGYKDKEVEPGIWRVSASANAISGGESLTRATTHYRAAGILKAKGFTHMRILEAKGFELGLSTWDGAAAYQSSSGGPGYTQILVRGASGADDVAGCRSKRPERCITLSIDEVMAAARPFIRFKNK